MIGQGSPTLTCTVGVAVLTCALTLSVAFHDTSQDQNIFQVMGRKFLDNDLPGAERKFKIFMETYDKRYATKEEYLHRLGIFAKNMIRAVQHQALDPTAIHGVTPFSDLSAEEFERLYAGVTGGPQMDVVKGNYALLEEEEVRGLPESFDWREQGAVTEVKMQVKLTIFNFFSTGLFCCAGISHHHRKKYTHTHTKKGLISLFEYG